MADTDGAIAGPGTVQVELSDKLRKLFQRARQARDMEDTADAAQYYNMILVEAPTNWEATFYAAYYRAMSCTIAQIASAMGTIKDCLDVVLPRIKEQLPDPAAQDEAVGEVVNRVAVGAVLLSGGAQSHYNSVKETLRPKFAQGYVNNVFAAVHTLYHLGDSIEAQFAGRESLRSHMCAVWTSGVELHKSLLPLFAHREQNELLILAYSAKLSKYDPASEPPKPQKTKKSGCYVATAVYGSYDCPEVWTLRRFRDDTLARTRHGRAFIRVYYALSPALVALFGKTAWFQRLWRPWLDRMVAHLAQQGVSGAPYADRDW